MDPQLRSRAEARLLQAAGELALNDPRPAYRDRLRELRERHPAAFDRAVAHYESAVLPALADAPDPLTVWTDYGAFLGGLTAEGRTYRVDGSGRATPFRPPLGSGELILFVPEDTAADVLLIALPADATAAQQATVELLVRRKLVLQG